MPTQAADLFYDGHDNATVGTNVDATIMAAGARESAAGSWSYTNTNAAAMKISSTTVLAPYCKFTVGGTDYTGGTTRGLVYDHTYDSSYVTYTLPSTKTAVSLGFMLTVSGAVPSASLLAIDYAVLPGNTGKSVYAGLAISQSIPFRLGLETIISGASTETICYWTGNNVSMWVTLKFDCTTDMAYMSAYNPVTWQLLGTAASSTSDNADTINSVIFGQNRSSTMAGCVAYLSNMVADYTNATYPLGVPQQPSAPTAPSASAASSSSNTVSWSVADTKEQGFQVFRSTDNTYFGLIATTAAAATSYTDTGLQAGTTYYYKVRAHNVSYDSAYTSTVSATTTVASGQTRPGKSQVMST